MGLNDDDLRRLAKEIGEFPARAEELKNQQSIKVKRWISIIIERRSKTVHFGHRFGQQRLMEKRDLATV